jgi:tape measure domain-containing protein
MSNKIKSDDIFDSGIFDILTTGAEEAQKKIALLNAELTKVGTSFKSELGGSKPTTIKEIESLISKTKELTDAVDKQTKVNAQQAELNKRNRLDEIRLQQAREKAVDDFNRKEQKENERATKETEKRLKNERDLADSYKQLTINTRDLKNESKRLGAEMLELEKQGKKNSAEYYKLSRQYKETTKSAVEGDKALKKLDSTVGDNFRNVGNYQKAIGGLKNALMQLGLAFGVFDGIRYLLDTQVKLDSLNLSLKNVSGTTEEYNKNFAFLTGLAKAYGQDLLILIDTYKNFIASSESSSLSLLQRKKIYESIIKAGSALALSNQDVEGSLRAISQMFSKGTVSSEELRQQLGERLPGAFKIMAQSMGVTEIELNKMLKNGQVLADDVLPAFARAYEVSFGEQAKERLQTMGGAFNNLKTNIILYFDSLQKSFNINKSFAFVINTVANNIKVFIDGITQLVRVFVLYKTSMIALSFIEKSRNKGLLEAIANTVGLSFATDKAEASATKLGRAFKGVGKALQALSVAVIAEISFYLYKSLSGAVSVEDKINRLSKQTEIGLKNTSTFINNMYKKSNEEMAKNTKLFKDKQITKEELLKREAKINENNLKTAQTYLINIKDRQKQLIEDRKKLVPDLNSTSLYIGGQTTQAIGKKYNIEADTWDLGRLRTDKVYNQLTASLQSLYEQEKAVNSEIQELGRSMKKVKADAPNKTYAEQDKLLRDLNTEYKTTNEYLSRHLELMIEITQHTADRDAVKAQEEYNKELEKQQKILENTGDYSIGSLYYASEEEKSKMMMAEQNQFDSKKLLREKDYKEKYDELNASLEEEKEKKVKNAEDIEKIIALKRKNAEAVRKNKTSSASARQNAEDDLRWATMQENDLAVKKIEIENNYQAEKKHIEEQAKKERRDLDEEELNQIKILGDKKADIEKQINEKIAKDQDEFELKKAEMRLDRIKKTAESVNTLIQKSLEHYINMAERRIDMLDKRMDRMSTQADFLREKAVAGNIQAQESLAVIDKQQIDAQKERINEQRSIQRLQMAMTVFQAYSNNIQNAKVGENPFTKTLTDITLLNQVINSLPTFIDGTETNIASALGKPQLQGQDGYIVRVDGSEKVLNPQLSAMTGNMTTMEIAKLAEDFRRGDIMRKGEGAMQLNVGSWGTDMIVSKLESLEQTIKNKPENQVEVAEILNGVMHIVETKKSGNTKVRNISRFS